MVWRKRYRRPGLAIAALLLIGGSGQARETSPPPIASFDSFSYAGTDGVAADRCERARCFRNPILAGFYPDPSIVRVGRDYYLVASTFAYYPGVPVFHSRDLVNWRQIGNAINRPSQLDLSRVEMSQGVFAPDISYQRGRFYILNTCVACGGNYIISAERPEGPWSVPHWLAIGGFDPSLFVDDDGASYIVHHDRPDPAGGDKADAAIWIERIDLAGGYRLGPSRVLRNGGLGASCCIEGPHLFRKDGWYYLITAEGGTFEQHSAVAYRARTLAGPFEKDPAGPFLTQRYAPPTRPHPITSTGHADLVETQKGEWWAVFLGVRPYRADDFRTGRETFLAPVSWRARWPRITVAGQAMPSCYPLPRLPRDPGPEAIKPGGTPIIDEFDSPRLAPDWLQVRTPSSSWFDLSNHPGRLVVTRSGARIGERGHPSYIGRRLRDLGSTTVLKMNAWPGADSDEAGMVVFQNDDYYLFAGLVHRNGETMVEVRQKTGRSTERLVISTRHEVGDEAIWLRADIRGEKITFAYAVKHDEWRPLGPGLDANLLSTKRAGGFVGATIGPYAYRRASS